MIIRFVNPAAAVCVEVTEFFLDDPLDCLVAVVARFANANPAVAASLFVINIINSRCSMSLARLM